MKKSVSLLLYALIFLSLPFLASACGGGGGEENPFGVESELVAPLGPIDALAFAPDGRLFWADHWGGNVGVVTAEGELLADPVTHFEVAAGLEWGLTGLAIDPDFETNHYIYAYFTELVEPDVARPVVVRFTEADNKGSDPKVIVGDLPDTRDKKPYNASGSIHFGPDGFLYFTLGDYDVPALTGSQGKELPQDLSTPAGKMLRVNKEDGSAPSDNPFLNEPGADPRIFAYGFRENFYFTFHPENGQIYGSDNTSVACEELNLIKVGANYGWPAPFLDCLAAEQTPGIHFFAKEGQQPGDFGSSLGVLGMAFVSGDVYPLLGDGLLVCGGGNMFRLVLSGNDLDQVVADDIVVDDCFRDIAISPDGIVYYSNETEIRRLVPLEPSE